MERDQTFDVMKGIGILAMVIGHYHTPSLLRQFIFVWHMPLFFLLSGFFFKPKPEIDSLKRNSLQLLLPYVVTAALVIFMTFTIEVLFGVGCTTNRIIGALIGNGSKNNPTFGEYTIGAIWFLPALFWCRIIFNYLFNRCSSKMLGWIILSCSSIATYIGSKVYVPTDILVGIGALLFFYIGFLARTFNFLESDLNVGIWVFVTILLTCLSIESGSMSMVRCYYGYWPINFLAAIGMVYLIYLLSKKLVRSKLLNWCGRMSIVILCAHQVEYIIVPIKQLGIPIYMDTLIHLTITILISYMAIKVRFVKLIFSLRCITT